MFIETFITCNNLPLLCYSQMRTKEMALRRALVNPFNNFNFPKLTLQPHFIPRPSTTSTPADPKRGLPHFPHSLEGTKKRIYSIFSLIHIHRQHDIYKYTHIVLLDIHKMTNGAARAVMACCFLFTFLM